VKRIEADDFGKREDMGKFGLVLIKPHIVLMDKINELVDAVNILYDWIEELDAKTAGDK